MNIEICSSVLKCAYDFQTLISAFVALIAAFVAYFAAGIPVRSQDRKDRLLRFQKGNYIRKIIAKELDIICSQSKLIESQIKVIAAANKGISEETRERSYLIAFKEFKEEEVFDALKNDIFSSYLDLKRQIYWHNYDMKRACGSYGADNFRDSIYDRLSDIKSLAASLRVEIEKAGLS